VPPLLLQPLVENAVHHGVEPAPEGGIIRVRTRVRLGRAVVSIAIPESPGASEFIEFSAGVSSAFLPQLTSANARVSDKRATIARAKSLRMFFNFTSSRSSRIRTIAVCGASSVQ